jgi:hypothetical protein
MSNNPTDQFPWFTYLEQLLPYRYKKGKYVSSWFHFLESLKCQVISQLQYDSVYFRHTKHPNSPDDVLATVGLEYGVIKASGESDLNFRNRINNRWGVLPYYGQEATLLQILNDTGLNAVFNIEYNLPGTDFPIGPVKTGPTIPAYPPSSEHYSQFILTVTISNILGSGTESNLMTDSQLNTIRAFIRLLKPVDWVCREIVVVYNPDTQLFYNDGINHFDDDGLVYEDRDNPGNYVSERHRGW